MKKNENFKSGFSNLRNEKDQLLRFSSDDYCKEQCNKISEIILGTSIAINFINAFNYNDIKVFVYKKIFEDFKIYFSYIYLQNYNKKNIYLIVNNENIYKILKKINNNVELTLKIDQITNIKKKIKFFIKKFLKKRNNIINDQKSSKISISYIEGYDPQKKNDLFWFYNSQIKRSDILVYYESDDYKFKHDFKKKTGVNYFKSLGIKDIKINNFFKPYFHKKIDLLFQKIDNNKINDTPYNKYTNEIFLDFLNQIEKWYSFFKHHNIKIDITNLEIGTNIIAKKIAINLVDGCTIKKVRSYIGTDEPRSIAGWHNEDVVMVWGKDLYYRLKDTINYPNTTVITGHYSGIKTPKISDELKLFLRGPNKKVLLLDNAWSENTLKDIENGKIQLILKEDYILFYNKIINYIKKKNQVSLVIKPKKDNLINKANNLKDELAELINQGKCYIISDSFQFPLEGLISKVDIVITTSIFFPTILYESILKNNNINSYHYDYSNLELKEEKVYKNFKDKIFFRSMDKMMLKIDEDLSLGINNKNLWHGIIKEIDPYNDNQGNLRITYYIESLFNNLKNSCKKEAIKNTNILFKKKYGEDKIII